MNSDEAIRLQCLQLANPINALTLDEHIKAAQRLYDFVCNKPSREPIDFSKAKAA